MSYLMLLDESDYALEILARRPNLEVAAGDLVQSVVETPAGAGVFDLTVGGKRYSGWRAAVGDEVYVRLNGRTFVVGLPQAHMRAHVHTKGDAEIHADMPGTMIAIHGEPGQEVKAGDKLVTIESMKLQVTLVAQRDGVIEKFHVAAETAFERGALLVSFVAPETEATPAQTQKAD